MGRIIEVSFGFPTVIFTTLLIFSLAYWILSSLLGAGAGDGLDVDMDLDLDLDGDIAEGLGGLMRTFHLHHIPLSLTFTFLSLFGWFTSVIATSIVADDGSAGVLVGVAIFLGALFVAGLITGRLGQMLAPVFRSTSALARNDLIGRLCVIRTGSVTPAFGQAEAVDSEGGTHLIQVRCEDGNTLTQGSHALLVTVDDDGIFQISPDVQALT